ncbi:MAG: T9SS type A sorting domain-containing protein [Bacteroidota bacterium]|nr:T9SS type A sorting domain-containing protein [Bacteroidota bacterium]
MKKQLLLSSALFISAVAISQNNTKAKPSGIVNLAEKLASKYSLNAIESQSAAKLNINPSIVIETAKESNVAMPPTNISWKSIAGSMNVYGMTISQTKPLQYNDNLNAVSFIHRKSASYTASPASNSGAIVAEISTNWGTSWDSTCVYSSASAVGRYPQGGIYNPLGNTNIANAYIVANGPTTDGGSNWLGNFYASKQLGAGNYNATASGVTNAMQLMSNQSTTYAPGVDGPQLFSYGFSSTDDGKVHAISGIYSSQQTAFRGVRVAKSVFSAGVFTWTFDSIVPPALLKTDGSPNVWRQPQMAWNESGTVGYIMFLGALNTATASNRGYQPIVYKTTNSGASWALINTIDFNSVAMAPIKAKIATVNTNTALEIPFFNVGEGYDCVVDANNKLHIASTIIGTARAHEDSLLYSYSFTTSINPNDAYQWSHTPGERPYLYDFVGDGSSAWTYATIDSISSEGPSSQAAAAAIYGFAENPWDANPTDKIDIDSRIQLSRTPDGQFITYTWAESDSNITNGAKKWNNLPNIKTRCFEVSTGTLSATEINVSKVAVGQGTNNPSVANRATLHYIGATTGAAVQTPSATGHNVDIKTPFTVTNSNPYAQTTNNVTWYSTNTLSYYFPGPVGVKENANTNSASNSVIYPNPTKDNAVLAIDLKENSTVAVSVFNLVGALVKTITANAVVGNNTINLDLTNLTSGVYLANVKVGNSVSTKKLIIE